jgi:hypothetical protein
LKYQKLPYHLTFLLLIGVIDCSLYEPYYEPVVDVTSEFWQQYNSFNTAAKALAKETQLIQQHECWHDFATTIRQAIAKAYVEDNLSGEIALKGMWPKDHKLPNATERKFVERYTELFNRSKVLEKERKRLINEWPQVQIAFETVMRNVELDDYTPTYYKAWHIRENQVNSTLYGYELNDLGLFVRR